MEGKFQEIDNKISMLWSLKGAFTKDFHKTGRTQYRASFKPMLDSKDIPAYDDLLGSMIEKSLTTYRADPKKYKIEIKDLQLDGSEEWDIAFARSGKNHDAEVRYCRDANSIETGVSVDELNQIFKQDLTIKPFLVDIIVTPWVFEVHHQVDGKYESTGVIRAGVTLYLKRVAGVPPKSDSQAPAAPVAGGKA